LDKPGFELFYLIQSLPQRLDGETDQRIGSGICHKNPIKTNRIKTKERNWASKSDKSHNRVGRGQARGCGCQSINCPEASYDDPGTRPHSNPVFHASDPIVL
jgi:hypothetical protein